MDQTTLPSRPRPVTHRRRIAPVLVFWVAALMLVGARVALFDGIRPDSAAPGSVVLASR